MSQTDDKRTRETPVNGIELPKRSDRPPPPPVRSNLSNLPKLPNRPNSTPQPGRPVTPLGGQGVPVPGVAKSTTPNADAAARSTALIRNRKRRRRITQIVILAIAALLVGAGVLAAVVVVPTVTSILTAGEKILQTPVPVRVGPGGTPIAALPPEWQNKEPVNILLLGLDYRAGDQDTRADTQIIVHVDLAAKTASMVSIPRDLWVTIPGFGEGRINTSYQLGESNKETILGGGPTLAMSTIQQNFGIPIHYFAQVDFDGFARVLDAMGGITIDVPRPLVDNEYPLPNYGTTRIYIPAGLQHMDGSTALQYARSRHADSDIGRNSRQQQVLLALKQQGLNMNIVSRLTDVMNQLAGAVKTDLTLLQIKTLAELARDVGPQSIQTVLIEPPMVNSRITAGGADVLIPDWNLIRPKIAQAFGDPKLGKEAARISVLNGTTVAGMARKTSDALTAKGFAVVNLGSVSDPGSYPVTTIIDYTGGAKPYTVEALAKTLGIDLNKVVEGDPSEAPLATAGDGAPVDIVVIAGDDRAK